MLIGGASGVGKGKLAFAIRMAGVMSDAVEYVIANRLEGGRPMVLEGDFLLPSLAVQTAYDGIPAAGQVRAVIMYEEDEEQIARNFVAGEGGPQPERARMRAISRRNPAQD